MKPAIGKYAIRRATVADAEEIVEILRGISSEQVYTAIDQPWSTDQQRHYLSSLSTREAIHVAEAGSGSIVGYQTLDLWAPTLRTMAHVGQLGTFLAPKWRRQGVGESLFNVTLEFARTAGFSKFVIQVRAANLGAQAFYKRLGFRECGRLARQVRIHNQEEDEILMEYFF